ncbi:hypothetical protein [Citreimonas sp.]|uniref:hypothetical protein n=1 Tax=Citreimonas sp. TaxID=3036715 RepID=UPI0040582BBD
MLIVKDDVVVNVIDVDPGNVPPEYAAAPEAPEGVGVGMVWDGSAFVRPAPPTPPLPATLAKLAIRDEAAAQGIWSDLKTFIAADADRQERWDLAIAIPTDDPILTDAQAALGWTDAQTEVFIRACAAR